MRAARLHAPRVVRVDEVPPPVPQAGEVLVRVDRIGVCGSDVHLFLGDRPVPYPLIMGHEGLGRIEGVGPGVSRDRLNERVVLEPNVPCGVCAWCRRGRGSICPAKRSLGVNVPGAFAEYVTLPASHAWAVPEELPWQEAVLIEPLAVAVHALAVAGLKPGDGAVVLGCGAIGLLLTQLLAAVRVNACVIDLDERRVQAARRAGAVEGIVMTGDAAAGLAERLRATAAWPVVFECSGAGSGAAWCLDAVPRGGTVVLVGLVVEKVPLQPLRVVREGITVVGSIIYDHPDDFRRTIRLVQDGMRVGHLVEREFPIGEVEQALVAAGGVLTGKAVIRVS
ncbi:MAG: alcohol dehydrogenase catalytic domain-containing protein [Armatimonadota bacterium]|nr:alcohol dehydrogenase catalytic domain-containing protein [Armatimonadota bacterium]